MFILKEKYRFIEDEELRGKKSRLILLKVSNLYMNNPIRFTATGREKGIFAILGAHRAND
jgi:hypothetical protein